jgi:hypothetical protein
VRASKLLVVLLIFGVTVTGCAARSSATPESGAASDASQALDKVSLGSLLPTVEVARDAIGVSLSIYEKPEITDGNKVTPRPTDGFTHCQDAINNWRSAPYKQSALLSFDGAEGRYTWYYLRFESNSGAVDYFDSVTKIGKYCPLQPESGITAWDSGIPNTAGFTLVTSTTGQLAAFRKGKIIALAAAPSPGSATKLLQQQIRTLAAVK